jgi:hypothetical protein
LNASQLLAAIEARGAIVTVKAEATGAAKIQIAPSGLVNDIAGEIQKFKPALVELLSSAAPPLNVSRYDVGAGRTLENRQLLAREVLKQQNESGGFTPGKWLLHLWRAINSVEGRELQSRELSQWARATLAQPTKTKEKTANEHRN